STARYGQGDGHALRPAHAHRECALRCGALFSHRCALLSGWAEGGFRHGPPGYRQRPLSAGRSENARLRRRAGSPDLPRSNRYAGRCEPDGKRSDHQFPSPSSPADYSRLRPYGAADCSALVEWSTLAPDNLQWTAKQACHLGEGFSVEIQASEVRAAHHEVGEGPETLRPPLRRSPETEISVTSASEPGRV